MEVAPLNRESIMRFQMFTAFLRSMGEIIKTRRLELSVQYEANSLESGPS